MVRNNLNKLTIPLRQKASCEVRFLIDQAVSETILFKDCIIVYMNIARGNGSYTSRGGVGVKFWL